MMKKTKSVAHVYTYKPSVTVSHMWFVYWGTSDQPSTVIEPSDDGPTVVFAVGGKPELSCAAVGELESALTVELALATMLDARRRCKSR